MGGCKIGCFVYCSKIYTTEGTLGILSGFLSCTVQYSTVIMWISMFFRSRFSEFKLRRLKDGISEKDIFGCGDFDVII